MSKSGKQAKKDSASEGSSVSASSAASIATEGISDLLEKHRALLAADFDLYQRGLRHSLLFPAKLRITLQSSEKKWVASVTEATKFTHNLGGIAPALP